MCHKVSNFQIHLKARHALSDLDRDGHDVGWLKVFLEPFEFHNEVHESCIRLDDVKGLRDQLSKTAGKPLKCPHHLAGSDIDGSLYFFGRHHTVDIKELVFGSHNGCTVPLTVIGTLTLTGWPEAHPVALELKTHIVLPLAQQEIENRVSEAIRETGATSLKHLGKVMAYIRPTLHYEREPALVAAYATKLLTIAA